MNRMLIEGPEPADLSQPDDNQAISSNSHKDSVTSQPTTGVLLLGMIALRIVLVVFPFCIVAQ